MLGRTNTGGGGGGGGLNFKVICNPQPSTAKENTIWVDADKINNYFFSPTQPENMVEYDVWFPTGTSGSTVFNALKKNSIIVYPISAKQKLGGVLVDKTAKSYQNGEWKPWTAYLYNNGDECLDTSGGWTAYAYKTSTSGSSQAAPTVTKKETTILVSQKKVSSGTYYAGALFSEKAVDLTNYNTLTINVVSASGSTTSAALAITATKANKYIVASEVRLTDIGEISIDLSGITGEYYVLVKIEGPSTKTDIEFSEIYLK